jgi:hypothetical protein
MMIRRVLLVVFVLSTLALTTTGCADKCPDSTFRLEGVVLHPEGGPIQNAVLEITAPATDDRGPLHVLVITDAEGKFRSDEITRGICEEMTLEINASRYVERVLTYRVPNGTDDEEVTEQPVDELPEELEIVLLPAK